MLDGAAMKGCRCKLHDGMKIENGECVHYPCRFGPIMVTVWLPNFKTPHCSPTWSLAENLSKLITLDKARIAMLGGRAEPTSPVSAKKRSTPMYREIPDCRTPPDYTMLWRYVDFTKLVSMLEKNSLYFCRSDLPGDKYEGAYPPGTWDKINFVDESGKTIEQPKEEEERKTQAIRTAVKNMRLTVFVMAGT